MTDVTTVTSTSEMPGFRLLFPQGWKEFGVDEASEQQLIARTRTKVKRLARPDLDFSVVSSVKSAFRQMRSVDAIAVYLPVDVPESAVIPMSMTASRLMDPMGLPLDDRITTIFREFGGEFLGTDRTIVRWRRTQRNLEGLPGAVNEQVNYAIPVGGTARRLALLLSTSIIQDGQGSVDKDNLDLMIALSDSIAGTFTWTSPRESRG